MTAEDDLRDRTASSPAAQQLLQNLMLQVLDQENDDSLG